MAGLLHDIGKIGIPDAILTKDSKLDDNEYSQIKEHPVIGAHILGDAEVFKDIIPIVKHHHERYDGHGYPSQLSGEDIPYMARILTIADCFDAMTARRPYKKPLSVSYAVSELKKNSGTQFDPELVNVFIRLINEGKITV